MLFCCVLSLELHSYLSTFGITYEPLTKKGKERKGRNIALHDMDQDVSFPQPNRRNQFPHAYSPTTSAQAPWTAARCNRLLRPISSRIALLRKGGNHEAYNLRDGSGKIAKRRPLEASGESMCSKSFGSARTETYDHDWAPSPRPRKRIKRTYSAKHGNRNNTGVAGKGSLPHSEQSSNIALEIPANAFRGDMENQPCGAPAKTEGGIENCSSAGVLDSEFRKDRLKAGHRYSHVQPRETLRRLTKSVSPAHWMLVDGLYSGFDALLKATTRSTEIHKPGTRSLLSTSLRKVPEYIDQEQLLCAQEDPNGNVNISSIVYADLEGYGHSDAGGWKPLREVVRAHGVAMLGTAIEEDLVTFSIARGLVIICLHVGAYDEAQHIIQSMVKSMELRLVSRLTCWDLSEEKMRDTLSILNHFVTSTGRSGFQYSILASMLSRGILSIDWISSHTSIKCWNAVIREVSQQGSYAQEAGLLLRTAASLSYNDKGLCMALSIHDLRLHSREHRTRYTSDTIEVAKPILSRVGAINKDPGSSGTEKDSCTTISSLLTVLISICILHSVETVSMVSQRPTLRTLEDIAQEAQKAIKVSAPISCEGLRHKEKSELITITILAAALAKTIASKDGLDGVIQSSIDFDAIANSVGLDDDISDCIGSFINAVAHCCARATSNDPLQYLKDLVRHLSEIARIEIIDLVVRRLCARSALAAAFQYSEKTGEPRHLEWALDIQQSLKDLFGGSTHRCAEQTPAQSRKNTNGYRWEEGICEWVTKTPCTLWPQSDRQTEHELVELSRDDGTYMQRPYSPSRSLKSRLSEISPCFPVKSVHFRIRQQGRRQYPASDAAFGALAKNLPSENIRKPCRRVSDDCQDIKDSGRRTFQSIHADEDADELSTAESSQDNPSTADKWLREVKNIVVKPRRRVHHASKLRRSTGTSGDTVQAASFKAYQAGQDVSAAESYSEDELGV